MYIYICCNPETTQNSTSKLADIEIFHSSKQTKTVFETVVVTRNITF